MSEQAVQLEQQQQLSQNNALNNNRGSHNDSVPILSLSISDVSGMEDDESHEIGPNQDSQEEISEENQDNYNPHTRQQQQQQITSRTENMRNFGHNQGGYIEDAQIIDDYDYDEDLDDDDFEDIELDEQDDIAETKFDQIMNMDPVELQKSTILHQSQESILTEQHQMPSLLQASGFQQENDQYEGPHEEVKEMSNYILPASTQTSLQQRFFTRQSANTNMVRPQESYQIKDIQDYEDGSHESNIDETYSAEIDIITNSQDQNGEVTIEEELQQVSAPLVQETVSIDPILLVEPSLLANEHQDRSVQSRVTSRRSSLQNITNNQVVDNENETTLEDYRDADGEDATLSQKSSEGPKVSMSGMTITSQQKRGGLPAMSRPANQYGNLPLEHIRIEEPLTEPSRIVDVSQSIRQSSINSDAVRMRTQDQRNNSIQSRNTGNQKQSTTTKSRSIKVRQYMKERNRSKESLGASHYQSSQQHTGAMAHRNLKKASFKSVKCSGGDLGASQSRSRWDDGRSSNQGQDYSQQQDQYSSHKVLISGKHIAMHFESQQNSATKEPQHQPSQGIAANSTVNKRTLSKQRKLKGLAKAVHTKTNVTNRDDSEYTPTQQQILQSSTSKHQPQHASNNGSTSGYHQVTSSLQQLFSGSTKRGASNNNQNNKDSQSNNHMAGGPMTQKQTKSKARMIRNILHTSNLNTEKKRAALQSSSKTAQFQQQHDTQPQIQVVFQPLYESQNESAQQKQTEMIDQAFADLFSNLMESAVTQNLPIDQDSDCTTKKAELDLKRSQTVQKYLNVRQNLKSIYQKFEFQQSAQIASLKSHQQKLNKTLDWLSQRALTEISYLKSREQTRIWRNVNKLSLSWVISLLVEAEKSRQFALMKTKRSLDQIVFSAQEFTPPKKVSSKGQATKNETQTSPMMYQQIIRSQFAEFQAQEVYKFLSKLSSPLQFLIDFRAKPFTVTKDSDLQSPFPSASSKVVTAEQLATQKKQSVPQSVLDFAKSAISAQLFEEPAHPVCVISSASLQDLKGANDLSFLEVAQVCQSVPSPFEALKGTQSLMQDQQETLRQTRITSCEFRKLDSLVSNQVLDVLQASSQRRCTNRFVYVCLKEAQSMDIELPRHQEMLNRMSQNKAIERLYHSASSISQCLKKTQFAEKGSAKLHKAKPIKGLGQLKVEFQEQPSKLFGVLAETDVSILNQSKEFVEFYMASSTASQSFALLSVGAPKGVSLYVLESFPNCQQKYVRKLEPFEVLFLLQFHLRLSKPARLISFVTNTADLASWKSLSQNSACNQSNAICGGDSTSLKAKVQQSGKIADSRNSITIGTIIHENNEAEEFKDHLPSETQRYKKDGFVSDSILDSKGSEKKQIYVIIDEKSRDSHQLLKRYIVRLQNSSGSVSFNKDSQSTIQSEEEETICVWPNCMKLTDSQATQATQHHIKLIQQYIAAEQNLLQSSNNHTANQAAQNAQMTSGNQTANTAAAQSSGLNTGGLPQTRKNRPDSAYRQKQNASSAHHQNQSGDKVQTRRLNKLRVTLEMDLADNIYSRFIKKGKSLKDKSNSYSTATQSNTKTRTSWNISGQNVAGGSNQIGSIGRYLPEANNNAITTPVLSTMLNQGSKGAQQAAALQSNISLSPFFARLCPFHQSLERFLANRFNLALMPNGPLNPNAFLKGLRTFNNWKSETKSALISDLFQTKNITSEHSLVQKSIMADTLDRIFNFACSQVAQVSGPDIVSLIQTLQQIPKTINYPDKFFQCLQEFTNRMSPFMVKNAQFSDAVAHYQFQLAPLSANLKQVKLNEDFIVAEVGKWIVGATGLQKKMTGQQHAYLISNFNQLLKILQVSDVVHRFTFFQQFINKMSACGQQSQNQIVQQELDNHQPQRNPNQQQNPQQNQQQRVVTKANIVQKANLMPYASQKIGTGGPIKAIPPEGILFQSNMPLQQPGQVVAPLSALSHQDQYIVVPQGQQPNNNSKVLTATSAIHCGVTVLDKRVMSTQSQGGNQTSNAMSSTFLAKNKHGSFFHHNSLSQPGGNAGVSVLQHFQQQQPPALSSGVPQLLPNAGQAPINVHGQQQQSTISQSHNSTSVYNNSSTLDKITAIYGMQQPQQHNNRISTSTKQQHQQPKETVQMMVCTPTQASGNGGQQQQATVMVNMMASDGFLAKKKQSTQLELILKSAPGQSSNLLSMPRTSAGPFHQQHQNQDSHPQQNQQIQQQMQQMSMAKNKHAIDFFSADLVDQKSGFKIVQSPNDQINKPMNLFTEKQNQDQKSKMQQSSEIFKVYNFSSANQLPFSKNYGQQQLQQQTHKSQVLTEGTALIASQQKGQANLMRPNTCHTAQSFFNNPANQANNLQKDLPKYARGKQRSNRIQHYSQQGTKIASDQPNNNSSLAQHHQVVNPSSALTNFQATRSPKKRFLSKQSAAVVVNQQHSSQNTNNIDEKNAINFLPVQLIQQSRGQMVNSVDSKNINADQMAQHQSFDTQFLTQNPAVQIITQDQSQFGTESSEFGAEMTVKTMKNENQSAQFVSKQGYATQQKRSFLDKSDQANAIIMKASNQSNLTNVKANNNKKKQRAISAKKELVATYSAAVVGNFQGPQSHKTTTNMASQQHWSMQPSTFGQALVQQEQQHQHTILAKQSNNYVRDDNKAVRLSMLSAGANNHTKHQSSAIASQKGTHVGRVLSGGAAADSLLQFQQEQQLVPSRYQSSANNHQMTGGRSGKDWYVKNSSVANSNIVNAPALSALTSSDNRSQIRGKPAANHNIARKESSSGQQHPQFLNDPHASSSSNAARYDSSVGFSNQEKQARIKNQQPQTQTQSQRGDAASVTAKPIGSNDQQLRKKKQPPRVPPQLVDSRVNYQSGIRIINSVLTPSNVPRSAVTAKPSHHSTNLNQTSEHNNRIVGGVGGLSDDTNQHNQQPIIVRNITSAGFPHSAKQSQNMIQIQRTTMIYNTNSNNNQAGADQCHNMMTASSKGVTQQLLNMQKGNNVGGSSNDNKTHQLQVTYANAMPRLASANAYLTKQSRKLRPSANFNQVNATTSKSSSNKVNKQVPAQSVGNSNRNTTNGSGANIFAIQNNNGNQKNMGEQKNNINGGILSTQGFAKKNSLFAGSESTKNQTRGQIM